jgi:hypothetical protein
MSKDKYQCNNGKGNPEEEAAEANTASGATLFLVASLKVARAATSVDIVLNNNWLASHLGMEQRGLLVLGNSVVGRHCDE